jgi:adenine-specific DNA-methyltransferase
VSVVRHNKSLELGNYRKAAEEGNFFLRGFNYLFIAQRRDNRPVPKPEPKPDLRKRDRRGRLISR